MKYQGPLGPSRAGDDGASLISVPGGRYPRLTFVNDDEKFLIDLLQAIGMDRGEVVRALANARSGLRGKGHPK